MAPDAQLLSGRVCGTIVCPESAFERPDGAAPRPIASAAIEVSFDDGAHWARVPGVVVGDRFLGIVLQPRGAAFASLRGTVEDVDGNRGEVTLIRAYRVAR